MESSYKRIKNFEERKNESKKMKEKYSDRIPIILDKHPKSTSQIIMKSRKFLVPLDLTISQFIYVIRKRCNLRSDLAIFLFTSNQNIPMSSQFLSTIYNDHKDEDGFLYLFYSGESTFG